MARQKRKKWQVCFEGERPSRRCAPGREMPIGKQFVWGGRRWQVPAVYRCAEGLVLDLVMQAPAGEIRAFMDRWGLGPASERGDFDREQQMRIDSENPLAFSFTPVLLVDGRSLGNYRGHSRCWNPVPGGRDPADLPMLAQYGLDPAEGWVLWRYSFPWKTKHKPPLRSLSLRLKADGVSLPGPHIAVSGAGGRFPFIAPDGTAHTLTVAEYVRETLPENAFQDGDFLYPRQYAAVGYTVEPPLPRGAFHLADCAEGDRPRPARKPGPLQPGAAAFATICALGKEDLCCDASSLYFELPEKLEWRMVFRHIPCEQLQIKLR